MKAETLIGALRERGLRVSSTELNGVVKLVVCRIGGRREAEEIVLENGTPFWSRSATQICGAVNEDADDPDAIARRIDDVVSAYPLPFRTSG